MSHTLSRFEARGLQRSLTTRIGNLSKTQNRSKDSIRYQLIFECFLNRVFSHSGSDWVLKGGTALLMRNGNGRFTQDVDLGRSQTWNDASEIRQEFENIAQRKSDDPFTFKVTSVHPKSASTPDVYSTPTVEVKLSARLGAVDFHNIKVDVSVQRHTQTPLEQVTISPLLNEVFKDVKYAPFNVLATAIESHLADKICAMYEKHRSGVSNRYHDLADIIQIIRTQNFSAEKLTEVLGHETARRNIDWPKEIVAPSPEWEKEYTSKAPGYDELPEELHTLKSSLDYVGACLNEVLQRQRSHGKWNFKTYSWEDC